MPPRLLLSGSQISTHFRCDNCGIQLDQVSWMQCKHCKEFDLCGRCSDPGYKLSEPTFKAHQKMHGNIPFDQDYLTQIFVGDAEKQGEETRKNRRQREFERILKDKKIQNDFDLAVVMAKLQDPKFGLSASSTQDNEVTSIVLEYNLKAARRKLHVLSLDGGGVRGYMSIKILAELITEKYLSNDTQSGSDETAHQKLLPKVDKEAFHEGQVKFTKQFDYFVGTSTGGLIAFCLAINYNILNMT